MFRVQADRLDDEVEFVGAVDLARYAVGHTGPNELGFGEVIEPVNSVRAAKAKLKVAEIPGDEPPRIGGEPKLQVLRWGRLLFSVY